MKLCITGYGQSGKDTAAAWLTANTSLIFTASSSACAAQVVFKRFQANAIYPRYNNVAECFADRRNHRARWAEIIWQYNQPDGLTLYREMMATQDILVGVRKSSELAACRAAGLFDLSIWIERPGYFEGKNSCEITAQDCDLSIVNGGTVEEFEAKLRRVASGFGLLNQQWKRNDFMELFIGEAGATATTPLKAEKLRYRMRRSKARTDFSACWYTFDPPAELTVADIGGIEIAMLIKDGETIIFDGDVIIEGLGGARYMMTPSDVRELNAVPNM